MANRACFQCDADSDALMCGLSDIFRFQSQTELDDCPILKIEASLEFRYSGL
jgi:hypothetical protein